MAALRVSTIKRLSTSCSKSHRVFCVFQSSFPCLIPASLCKHDEFIPEVAFKYPIIAIVSLQFSLLTFHDQFSWEKLKSLSLWGVSSSSFMCTNPRDCTQGTRGTPHVHKHPSSVHLQEGVQMFMQKHSFQPSGEQTPSWFYAMRFLHQLAPWWKRAPFGYLFLKCAGNRWSLAKKLLKRKAAPGTGLGHVAVLFGLEVSWNT